MKFNKIKIVNTFLIPVRFIVAILSCLGIFLFSLVFGLLQMPFDVLLYTINDAAISFRSFHINFPRFKKEITTKNGIDFIDLMVSIKQQKQPQDIK